MSVCISHCLQGDENEQSAFLRSMSSDQILIYENLVSPLTCAPKRTLLIGEGVRKIWLGGGQKVEICLCQISFIYTCFYN